LAVECKERVDGGCEIDVKRIGRTQAGWWWWWWWWITLLAAATAKQCSCVSEQTGLITDCSSCQLTDWLTQYDRLLQQQLSFLFSFTFWALQFTNEAHYGIGLVGSKAFWQ